MKALLTAGLMGTTLMTAFAGSSPSVARVIFAEAGGSCTPQERLMVASVMRNRIKHQGFNDGQLYTMYDSAYQYGAFSCVGDDKNKNWKLSKMFALAMSPSNRLKGDFLEADIEAWNQSLMLSRGNFVVHPDIVYYHDKSISKPKSWDNKYWTAVKEIETEHFVFYSVKQIMPKRQIG
jgi:hypothetical protein